MIDGKRVLAVIPARAGSKGLPGKNIKMLCGKPLIAWSIEVALNCPYIDTVMVTTDSDEIAVVARKFGAEVPFLRPEYLATDTATTFDAVKHVVDYYSDELCCNFDYVVLIEPTSPLRELDDLDSMLETISQNDKEFDAIVSLGEVHEHPSIMKKVDGSLMSPFCRELAVTSRRQDNEAAYFPYGVAYIVKTPTLLQEKTFYPERTTYFVIQRHQCYEIDDIFDFLAIENIMKYQRGLK